MTRIVPTVGRRETLLGKPRSRSLADGSLWVIVAVVFLCAVLGIAINTDLNISDNPGSARAASQSVREGNRPYNETAIGACLVCLLIAATRAEWSRRALRVLKSPIAWALSYQGIIAWHYLSDGNLWDLARTCGGAVLLVVAMAASPLMAIEKYVSRMLLLFRFLLWTSLVVGILLPNNGWQHSYYQSFIPGIYDRFSGVGGHANGMGAIASIAILLELGQFLAGRTRPWISVLHLGLGSALLLLTQSKTSLMACAICVVYLLLSHRGRFLPRLARGLMVALAVLAGSVVAWSAISEWVASNTGSLEEFSGRLSLWRYYLELGLDRPWFGYGTSLWSELLNSVSFKYQWAAGNAHNQILNSFLMAGVFGVGCLVAYVIGLFRSRRRMDIRYRPIFTAYLLFMVIRSFAEAGFDPSDLGVGGTIQIVLVGFCLCRPVQRSALYAGGVYRALRPKRADLEVQVTQQ